jgi:hypothetical protein
MLKIHLVPLVLENYLYAENMNKIGQKGDKYEVYKQVDMTGRRMPIGQRRPAPPTRRPTPPGATSAPCHVNDPWEHLLDQ